MKPLLLCCGKVQGRKTWKIFVILVCTSSFLLDFSLRAQNKKNTKIQLNISKKVPGVLHDSVVHQKKRVKVKGKCVWPTPILVKLTTHKLPWKKNRVKAGTQIIDRAWKFIKKRLRLNQFTKVGSSLLRAHIRSAQYEYWHRNRDLCACAGQLLLSIWRT